MRPFSSAMKVNGTSKNTGGKSDNVASEHSVSNRGVIGENVSRAVSTGPDHESPTVSLVSLEEPVSFIAFIFPGNGFRGRTYDKLLAKCHYVLPQ